MQHGAQTSHAFGRIRGSHRYELHIELIDRMRAPGHAERIARKEPEHSVPTNACKVELSRSCAIA
jgi:hypothetical protein